MKKLFNLTIRVLLKAAYQIITLTGGILKIKSRGVYIVVWVNDELLVIKNSYRKQYSVPGGGIKKGEIPVAAAVRELREETGVSLTTNELYDDGEFYNPHENKDDTVVFFKAVLDKKPVIKVDEREVIWADFLTVHKAMKLDLLPVVYNYLKKKGNGLQ